MKHLLLLAVLLCGCGDDVEKIAEKEKLPYGADKKITIQPTSVYIDSVAEYDVGERGFYSQEALNKYKEQMAEQRENPTYFRVLTFEYPDSSIITPSFEVDKSSDCLFVVAKATAYGKPRTEYYNNKRQFTLYRSDTWERITKILPVLNEQNKITVYYSVQLRQYTTRDKFAILRAIDFCDE